MISGRFIAAAVRSRIFALVASLCLRPLFHGTRFVGFSSPSAAAFPLGLVVFFCSRAQDSTHRVRDVFGVVFVETARFLRTWGDEVSLYIYSRSMTAGTHLALRRSRSSNLIPP